MLQFNDILVINVAGVVLFIVDVDTLLMRSSSPSVMLVAEAYVNYPHSFMSFQTLFARSLWPFDILSRLL